jgi:hypothetical protein
MLAAMHGDTEILEVLLEAEAVTDVQDKVYWLPVTSNGPRAPDLAAAFVSCRVDERRSCGQPRKVTLRPLFAC